MTCPYCESNDNYFIELNQTREYSGIEMSLNRKGLLRVRHYDYDDDIFTTQDIIEIKYCPCCGKEFDKR